MAAWLFTATPPKSEPPNNVIIDCFTGETFYVDDEYVIMGESEGWLKFTGYHTIGGVFYFTWEHTA